MLAGDKQHQLIQAGSLTGFVEVSEHTYTRGETTYVIKKHTQEILRWKFEQYHEVDAEICIAIVKRLSILQAGGWYIHGNDTGCATCMIFDGDRNYVNNLKPYQQRELCALCIEHVGFSSRYGLTPRYMFPRWHQRLFKRPTMSRAFAELLRQLNELSDYPSSVITGQTPAVPINSTLQSIQRLQQHNTNEAQAQHAREILAHQPDITAAELVEHIERQYPSQIDKQ